jgi:hypothetical protein
VSARLRRRRNLLTVLEFCQETGDKPDTVRDWIHRGLVEAIDLNAGTGKRPRWRIPARELQKRLAALRRSERG